MTIQTNPRKEEMKKGRPGAKAEKVICITLDELKDTRRGTKSQNIDN